MKPKRSALPVVKLALEKALAQLVLVQPRAKFAPHLPRVRKRTRLADKLYWKQWLASTLYPLRNRVNRCGEWVRISCGAY